MSEIGEGHPQPPCEHTLVEREDAACVDGLCPLCMSLQILALTKTKVDLWDSVERLRLERLDLKAEIERLNDARARDAALIDDLAARDKASLTEIARLNTWIGLHRGDTLSLDNDARIFMEQRDEADEMRREAQGEIARLVIENKHLHRVIRAIAIERVLLVRGSDDVPGFEICVQAEIACIEGQDA